MPPSSTISSKGQITVPIEIRKRLGLKAGDRVEFAIMDDLTVIRPAGAAPNPFQKFVGALPSLSGVSEINQWLGRLRDPGTEED